MGYYINPPDGQSKKAWLNTHGAKVHENELRQLVEHGVVSPTVPVCLVDNGAFTVAGIAFDVAEAKRMMVDDGRPKQWYLVPRASLKPFCSVL